MATTNHRPHCEHLADRPRRQDLPRDLPAKISTRSALVAWGIAVLILGMVNATLVVYFDVYPTNRAYHIIKEKWRLATELAQTPDVVVVGDSSCNQGVVPDAWRQVTGLTALNLCTIGNATAADDAWLLARAIESGGPPQRVIVVHTYDVWHRSVEPALLGQTPEPWGFWRTTDPALELSWHDTWRAFSARYLPVLARSRSIESRARAAVIAPSSILEPHFEQSVDGYMAEREPRPDQVAADTAAHARFVSAEAFSMSTSNLAALRTLSVMAERHGFEICLASAPVHEGLIREGSFQRYYRQTLAELRRMSAAHRQIRLVEL